MPHLFGGPHPVWTILEQNSWMLTWEIAIAASDFRLSCKVKCTRWKKYDDPRTDRYQHVRRCNLHSRREIKTMF